MIRHFTSTAFVVHKGATLLHWHRKVGEWLPPGGHIEPNEDPAEATLREVMEETGLSVEIVPTQAQIEIGNLDQVPAPHTIMIEDVEDREHGLHQHIDHIYFTRINGESASAISTHGGAAGLPEVPDGWHWVAKEDLEAAAPLVTPDGNPTPPPEDVIKLGTAAIDHVMGSG